MRKRLDAPASLPGSVLVSIGLAESVLNRLRAACRSSAVEVGGKLVGYSSSNRDGSRMDVVSYIDSGPNSDCSAMHLHPDGSYQEAVFRVLESFDPAIEHLGTWHSHHTNGLRELSSGDVEGYFDSVNSRNYNLDHFLALLATPGGRLSVVDVRYFLFVRGHALYYEIPERQIMSIEAKHRLEGILVDLEGLAMPRDEEVRAKHTQQEPVAQYKQQILHSGEIRRSVVARDNRFLQSKFSGVVAVRAKLAGTIAWRWHVSGFSLEYRHTEKPDGHVPSALLTASRSGQTVDSASFPLDPDRFDKVLRFVASLAERNERRGVADA